jgi:hypothetical protein
LEVREQELIMPMDVFERIQKRIDEPEPPKKDYGKLLLAIFWFLAGAASMWALLRALGVL